MRRILLAAIVLAVRDAATSFGDPLMPVPATKLRETKVVTL